VPEAISLIRRGKLFWIGLLAFAASFFLVSVASSPDNQGVRGYECASVTLEYLKWAATSLRHPSVSIVKFFPIVVAGLINPVFLVAALRPKSVLRIVWLWMIPSCWVVFYQWQPRLYPREGHFLWIAGMALVLFSDRLTGRKTASETDTA
jgi:hypothetical protein